MFRQIKSLQASSRAFCALLLVLGLVACVFVGDVMAGGKGNKGGGEDIILYNGNIVLRGNGGKGKGKGGGGSIVVANSQSHHGHEHMPMMNWEGMFRRR